MPRRKGKSTGRRTKGYSQNRPRWDSPGRRPDISERNRRRARRAVPSTAEKPVLTRRRKRRISRSPESARAAQIPRRNLRRGLRQDGLLDGGTTLQVRQNRTPSRRMPRGILPPRSLDASTRRMATTQGVCAAKKDTRRGVLIATGYGGVNGFRNYRKHSRC